MYKSLLNNISKLKSFNSKEGTSVNLLVKEKIADLRSEFWPLLKLNHILFNKIANLIGLFESHETAIGDVVYHLNNLRAFVDKELDSYDLTNESNVQLTTSFEDGIEFGLDSDTNATIENREEVPDDEFLYLEGENFADIDHTEVVS